MTEPTTTKKPRRSIVEIAEALEAKAMALRHKQNQRQIARAFDAAEALLAAIASVKLDDETKARSVETISGLSDWLSKQRSE